MSERAKAVKDVPHSVYFAHTMRRAFSVAARRGSAVVGLEHFLYALLDDPDALALMEGCGVDIASIRVETGGAIEKNTPRKMLGKGETPQAGNALRQVMYTVEQGAREAGRREVDGAIAVASLVGQSDSPVARVLVRHGLSFGKALGWIDSQSARGAPAPAQPSPPAKTPARPPALRQPAATPPRPNPRQRPAPASPRSRDGAGNEPTLEDMLATIRDVFNEEEPPEAQADKQRPANTSRKPAPAARPTPQGGKQPAAERREAPPPKPNGAAGPQKRRHASKARPEGTQDAPSVMGQLVERIPRVMREGDRENVEVRIAREVTQELMDGMQGRGAAQVHGVVVTRAMSLYLRAPDGGFMIEPLAPETQWVFDRPSFLDSEPFGRWAWAVLPLKTGSRRLQLVLAARSVDENGMVGDVALPEQVIEVRVRINWARSLRKVALWAALAIAGGALAHFAVGYVPSLTG